ncbi:MULTISPECIES: esterase family protein [Streptacidiphilus]|uniref:Alpha/beta hydrolase n=1 Tax=Streptacidiphilus cavernicola TaxID=3342716 RepID=A0ABV6UT14_9ACTN|nr:alpha/beta hydrolase-fold protein [Streptacidiphilus jeojiense]
MDLTSSTLEYGAGLLTFLSVCATLWLWPRLARRGLRRILGRLALIGASQLSLVLLAALLLNSYGDFYPTWTDLVGGGNQTVTLGRVQGGAGGSEEQVSDLGSRLVLPSRLGPLQRSDELPSGPPQRNGRFSAVTLVGERTGYRQQAYVYLPPQYFQPAYRHVDFPVLTSYVGYPGSIQTMVDRLRMPQIAAGMMQDGQMQPTIMVIVSQTVAPPRDTDCINAPGGPQAETYLTQDVPAALRSAYRVERDPRGWGLTGVSEGATCALENTLRHPGTFGVAASLGGEYWEYETSTTGVLFGPPGPVRDALLNSYNLVWRLQHLPVPDVRVLVATTAHGEHDYKGTQLFVRAAKAPLQITPLVLSSGGHNYTTWSLELEPALAWLGQQLNPPTAAPAPAPAATPSTVPSSPITVPSLTAVPG